MIKVVVTGGAGFIGSHLVDELLKLGHQVTVIDDLSNGKLNNLDLTQRHVTFYQRDLADYTLEELVEILRPCKKIYHLAGLADIVPSIENPSKYFTANAFATQLLAEAAVKAGIEQIIYAASSSCYGIPAEFPTSETAPIDLRYPYAFSKWCGERILEHFSEVYKLKVRSLRLFNVYGLRSRTSGTYGAVFGVFLSQKLNNLPLTVVGDGTQTRDFVHVSDVVNAFVLAGQKVQDHERFEFYNVGAQNPQSINKLVSLLGGNVVHIPKRPGEPDITFANIEKIRKHLGWFPTRSFEDGVGEMIENIQLWNDAPAWTPESIAKETSVWFATLEGGET
jgi:UDP-glucose 4-epimerase